MGRGYTVEQYCALVESLRNVAPDIKITTDIICGFPGETIEDFEQTKTFVQDIKFNAAFIFPYSRRGGTPADKMDNQLPHKEKKRRATELINIQREISKEK